MYIFDMSKAEDGSVIDHSTKADTKSNKTKIQLRSHLKGPELNFPKSYPKTLSRALLQAAESKQKIVFIDDRGEEKSLPYKQLKNNALQVLASLQQMGMTSGSAVVLQLDGLEEFLTSFWACVLGGMVPVPVLPFRNANIDDSSFRKLHTIVSELDHPYILMSEHNAELIENALQQKDLLEGDYLSDATITTFGAIQNCDQKAVIFAAKTNDLAFLQYTSGSTSFPKGAQITNANVLATVRSIMLALDVKESSVLLNWMPYYHDLGIIAGHIMAVVSCCKVVSMRPFTFVRRPIWWLEKIQEHNVTVTFSPNFGLKRILEKCKPKQLTHIDLSCLKVILNGAEPISIQTSHRFVDLLHTHCAMPRDCLIAGYGLAEASLGVSNAPLGEVMRTHVLNREKLGCGDTVEHVHAENDRASFFADEGYAVAGMEIRIVDDGGSVLPIDTVGNVEIKGRSVTAGYFANEEVNERSFNGKWFKTGDLGFVYDNRFIITGRVKDVIFVNGQNFYSHDFEHACEDIDGLEKLVVLGHFDPERNEEDLLAFVACNTKYIGAREKTSVLRETQKRINQCFDVTPTMFIILKSTGEIPKTTSGKIMRHKLLENYIEGNFSNQCIHLSELLEISPDLSTESDSGKHVTISEFKLLIRTWWSEVLGISENAIGDNDPFYSLGGTSIKAIEVITLAEDSVDCLITHDMFKEYDTIDGLANFIARENVSVRCKANRLVKLAPYREDLRSFDEATESVTLDTVVGESKTDNVIEGKFNTVSNESQDLCETDIAIVGMGCLFPQADNADEFWTVLKQGRDCISEFPSSRSNINKYYSENSGVENTTVSKWGGFVENYHFDPKFFSISETEALTMDPHQRIFLTAAWQAIQDSGMVDINGSRMGVFVGVGGSGIYQQQEDALISPSTLTGMLGNIVASRVSNTFNLKGPSMVVDTACSSSLVSVDLAVKSILNGECDTAVAGGAQVLENITNYLLLSRAGILSPQGKCFTFDEKANGFVPGEGAGAIVLKRYSDAVRDGDRVYAVIKASATNNDGASLGIMAPNPEGQEDIIRTVLNQADINPADIGYVEAHGTGTNIGDLIEVRGLSSAFNENHDVPNQNCAIGSVKTNMGHQLAAAGIAGLMKAALSVYHKEIPASLNCNSERKELRLAETPFYVNHKTKPWVKKGKHRLAAINSFGFGGTNAHMIIGDAYHTDIKYPTVTSDDEPLVYCLSAKTDVSLDASKKVFATFAENNTSDSARDVAYTCAARRDHYRQNRIAIVADSLNAAAAIARGEKVKGASIVERKHMSPAKSRIAWMFSGQGSQHPAMGKTLYENEKVFRKIINKCDEIASPLLGVSIRDLVLASKHIDEISSTAITQPLVFTMDYALACLWQSWGIKPNFMLGHSIGEYVAATLAEVFTLEDALKVVIKRGELMGSMPSGCGMTAVLQSSEELAKLIETMKLPLDIAAYNGPLSTVISGDLKALNKLHKRLDEDKVVCQPLSVSHAFHSRHMEPVLEKFRQFLSTVMMRLPTMPMVSNVTGELIEAGEIHSDYWVDYWVSHIRQPVQFHMGVETLMSAGTKVFMEIGAQEHLAGLVRRIVNMDKSLVVTSLPKAAENAYDDCHIANTKAKLYVQGVDIDWSQYYSRHGDRRISDVERDATENRQISKVAAIASVKMTNTPTYALEKRSMFRMVGVNKHPFEHLFKKTSDSSFEFVADPSSVLFKDHVISNMPILSGAGQCDLMSHLYTQVSKLPVKTLRNLSFHQPWLAELQLNVTFEGEEEKEFTVTNARGNPVVKGFASSFTIAEVPPSVAINEIEESLTHYYAHSRIYEIFDNCGVVYGPFHRNIAELRASPTQALARIKPENSDKAEWEFGYHLHPGILDSAFQAAAGIMLAGMAESGEGEQLPTLIPLGIESISNYKCLQESEYFSHVVLHESSSNQSDSDMVCCDITIYNLDGEPCASIKKLMLKRLPVMMNASPKPESTEDNTTNQIAASQLNVPAEFFQMKLLASPVHEVPLTEITCLIFGSSNAVELEFAPVMAKAGVNTILVPREHYSELDDKGMLSILEKVDAADSIVYLGDYADVENINEAADMKNMRCLFNLLKAISKASRSNNVFKKIQFIRVAQNALPDEIEGNQCDIRKSLVTGFLRSARMEFPLLNIRQLYFSVHDSAQIARKISVEIANTDSPSESYYNKTNRYDLSVIPTEVVTRYNRNDVFNKDKVFWIIGGTSGVGQLTARHLAKNYQASIILSGSRQLPDVKEFDGYVANNDDAIASTIHFIRELEAMGSTVIYIAIDIRSADSQRLSLDAIRKVHNHIDGIYFSALQLNDKMIIQKEWTDYRNMIDMRVNGLHSLIAQTQHDKLDFFITFSSLASITGNIGQSDYSASNEYMDTVPYVKNSDNNCRYISVQWGAWALGQQVSDVVLEHMKRSGFIHIDAEAGMAALEKIILSGEKNLAYVPGSLNSVSVAESINNLRIGLSATTKQKNNSVSKSNVIERTKVSRMKNKSLNAIAVSDGQMQMLMSEFDKQREMFMKLCENQNSLLAGSFDDATGSSINMNTAASSPESVVLAPQVVASVPVPAPVAAAVEVTSQVVQNPQQLQAEEKEEVTTAPAIEEKSTTPQGRPADLFTYVSSLMAGVLEIDVIDIDPDQNIMELGADSMTAMSMVKEMETSYDIELPVTLLFEYSTLNELVDYLKIEVGE